MRFGTLDEALTELERRLRDIAREARRSAIDLKLRRFEPVQQVVARAELAAGRVRAGVDLRGDGSFEAFTGRLRRAPVGEEIDETAFDALRRVLRGS